MAGYFRILTRLQKPGRSAASDDVVLGPMLDAMLSLGQNQNVLDLFPDSRFWRHLFGRHDSARPGLGLQVLVIAPARARQ